MNGLRNIRLAAVRRRQRREREPVDGYGAQNVVRLPSSITRLLEPKGVA